LLGKALDLMVEAGILPLSRWQGAEYLAWSAVHSLAFLVIEGPLRKAPEKEVHRLAERLLKMVEDGL
jgi:hypothetical protein